MITCTCSYRLHRSTVLLNRRVKSFVKAKNRNPHYPQQRLELPSSPKSHDDRGLWLAFKVHEKALSPESYENCTATFILPKPTAHMRQHRSRVPSASKVLGGESASPQFRAGKPAPSESQSRARYHFLKPSPLDRAVSAWPFRLKPIIGFSASFRQFHSYLEREGKYVSVKSNRPKEGSLSPFAVGSRIVGPFPFSPFFVMCEDNALPVPPIPLARGPLPFDHGPLPIIRVTGPEVGALCRPVSRTISFIIVDTAMVEILGRKS
jgi:hypothetical protein